jgi:predicted amidohydrolase YtcJ
MRSVLLKVTLVALVMSSAACDRSPADEPADLVLLHGHIVTMDSTLPSAEALAVRGDRIVAVGSDGEIDAFIGDRTQVNCQVVHPDDLPRFAQLGVISSVRGVFATSDGPWVIGRLGEERARERGYPYRSLFRSGAVVVNGTDPPVEDINPIDNFYRSVTRMMENGEVFFPEQRMTREQALASYTVNPAFAAFEEDLKGTLSVGKLADITVLSRDIFTIPEDEIRDAEIVYTIIGGTVRYSRPG